MLITRYIHRLPVDYDMGSVRLRAARRGPLWADTPGLVFKAFMIQIAGEHGATRNAYGSLYLWKDSKALSEFLTGSRFQNVISTFGRPSVETYSPIAQAAGAATDANFVSFAYSDIASEQPMPEVREIESTLASVDRVDPDCVYLTSAVDAAQWRILRIRISSTPEIASGNELYKIAHFARPGL